MHVSLFQDTAGGCLGRRRGGVGADRGAGLAQEGKQASGM